MARLIGYARVSTEEQTTDPQIDLLHKAGCSILFKEHASGGSRSRPELARALDTVRPGDVLVVARIDRLARSLSHLLEIVEGLDRRGAGFRSLGDPIDTTSPQGRFTLQILGAVAEFERALIRERTRAGIAAAKARGRTGGNPGLKAGDTEAIHKAVSARDRTLSGKTAAGAEDFLPLVRSLRPGTTWDQVVRLLNVRKIGRPYDGKDWTRDSLIRAVRRLVRDGLADAALLEPTPRQPDDRRLVRLVAAIANALPDPTLAAIGGQLEAMREATPRGRFRWSPSSVKNLLDRARADGLIREPRTNPGSPSRSSPPTA
jgi:DNA invertase Pin-like site-specific DNA recombinase